MGKIVGMTAGFMLGGPGGAILGLAVGHMYDTRARTEADAWGAVWRPTGAAHGTQDPFTLGVIALGAKMAKVDGRVTRAEIDAFKRAFHVRPDQEDNIGRLFDDARRDAQGFEPYAFHMAHVFRRNPAVLEEVLSGLFTIASADRRELSPMELTYLRRVAFIFGFDAEAFARIAAQSGVRLSGGEAPHVQAPELDAFAILGVSSETSPKDIKKAYHDLIRKHHPDRLIAQGMAPEFVATATEKMKRINVAYDKVCRIKGIK